VVHLVRDGLAIADIVPATTQPARAPRDPRHIQISQMMAERFGAPTLDHYRQAGVQRVLDRDPAPEPVFAGQWRVVRLEAWLALRPYA
jgi:hypothetical protein